MNDSEWMSEMHWTKFMKDFNSQLQKLGVTHWKNFRIEKFSVVGTSEVKMSIEVTYSAYECDGYKIKDVMVCNAAKRELDTVKSFPETRLKIGCVPYMDKMIQCIERE